MPCRPGRAASLPLLLLLLLGGAPGQARSEEARTVDVRSTPEVIDARAALELLEGPKGRREAWSQVPTLVVLTSVLEYTGQDMSSGYVATGEQLTETELKRLTRDLTRALDVLTGGAFKTFREIRHESLSSGQKTRVLRPGQIVVARYQGV